MIAYLTGMIIVSELEWLVLDVRGVGYEIHVPTGAASKLATERDQQGLVSLWIHTSVREDAIQLYGFAQRDERRLFRRLIAVNGVGPRLALAVLSELSASDVVHAVHHEDIKTFTRVSGIGKKTAQRLLLELKNKLDDFSFDDPGFASSMPDAHSDLRSALLNLGYQPTAIQDVVSQLAAKHSDDESLEALLRKALKMLH